MKQFPRFGAVRPISEQVVLKVPLTRGNLVCRKNTFLRRLFSTFARGWPGAGLLLLRLVIGVALVTRNATNLVSGPPIPLAITSVLLICAGILLIAGFWTPVVGTLVALIELWKIVALPDDKWIYLFLATMAASLSMIGPGAWSVDACRFGWKRIDPQDR